MNLFKHVSIALITLAACGLVCMPASSAPIANENALPPAELMVLGTPHLSNIKDQYDMSILDPLLDRLAAYAPDLIAIEALRGEDIAAMELRTERHKDALNPYAYAQRLQGGIAQAKLATNWANAQQMVETGLSAESDAERMEAVLYYLAAYDYYSALLTWYAGSQEFRRSFDSEHGELTPRFEKSLKSTNEFMTICLALAHRLGHRQLFPVDDHFQGGQIDAAVSKIPGGWESLMTIYGDVGNHPFILESDSRFEAAAKAGDLLPYYRWLNQPATGDRDEAFQWHPLMRGDIESRIGSVRLAAWEMRNLRIASHLAELLIAHPGKRLLFVVGSAHKPIIDRYFSQMTWVRVVPAVEVLGVAEQDSP